MELERFYYVLADVLTKNARVGLEALVSYLENTHGFNNVEELLVDLDGFVHIDEDLVVELL